MRASDSCRMRFSPFRGEGRALVAVLDEPLLPEELAELLRIEVGRQMPALAKLRHPAQRLLDIAVGAEKELVPELDEPAPGGRAPLGFAVVLGVSKPHGTQSSSPGPMPENMVCSMSA